MSVRVLIVDDEPLARRRLRSLLAGDPDMAVVGECGDGPAAVAAIRDQAPDLVFLDVQMPALDGLGVVAAVGPERMPPTVFVTAYDQYAVRAFDVNAVDYLLKPVDADRFAAALRRAKAQVGRRAGADLQDRLLALLADAKKAEPPAPSTPPADRLAVKSGGKVVFLRADEIDWIEAAGNYSRLHVGKRTHLLRETMTALEARLDPKRFVRIHRSTIVNLERIRELQPYFHGDYVVLLHDGTQLTLSRTHRQKLHEVVGHPF
ncbi:MAG TPA: LytTR family DNA-binding domain-containing protein [Gemmataceae bacterium]|jgi:two-component system LytT family response regulator